MLENSKERGTTDKSLAIDCSFLFYTKLNAFRQYVTRSAKKGLIALSNCRVGLLIF